MPCWLPHRRVPSAPGTRRRVPAPPRPRGPAHRLGAVTGLVLAISGVAVHGAGGAPEPALAQVHHAAGFHATVLGWTSWYGSYGMGDLGHGWCIDHGLRAPDPALGYAATPVTDASPDTRAAISWAVTTRSGADPVEAAAVMLVLHDLMGARYPFGVLHVDRLSLANLAGFAGREGQVLERARLIKADALAHRHLRGPFALTLTATPGAPVGTAGPGRLVARLVDVHGAPVAGAPVLLRGTGAELASAGARTGPDGTVAAGFTGGDRPATFAALAAVPDPALAAFAATRAAAQRIARPSVVALTAETALTPPPTTTAPPTTTRPPTTTTTSTTPPPTTTTTAPPTTTTTSRPTTSTTSSTAPPTTRPPATTTPPTTTPPTTTPPTTAPATTQPTVTAPPTTTPPTTTPPPTSVTTSTTLPPETTVPVPPETTLSAPPEQTPPDQTPPALGSSPPVVTPPTPGGVLPRTGAQVAGLALTGLGLVLLGLATVGARRAWRPGGPEGAVRTPRPPHDATTARDAGSRR